MTPEESLERMREKRERRLRDAERKRARMLNPGSLEEYHHLRYGDVKPPLQQTANLSYAKIKKR